MTRPGRLRASAVVLLAASLVSCGDEGDAGTTPCNPLVAVESPVTLARILGIGRHADGVTYVVDQPAAGKERVFASSGGALFRRRIAGTGAGVDWQVFTVDAESGSAAGFTLKIEFPAGQPVRMGVVRGAFTGRTFTVGEQGDVLEVLGSDAINGLPLHNLAGDQTVEYLADLADGRRVLVIRPTDDWTYDDFRVFVGPATQLAERRVVSVVREKDGGTTTITFDLEGAMAVAYFPAVTRMLPATLTVGAVTLALTLAPAGATVDGARLLCR